MPEHLRLTPLPFGGGGGSGATIYAVPFDSDGGTDVPSQKVKGGSKATRPANPTKEGNIFQG